MMQESAMCIQWGSLPLSNFKSTDLALKDKADWKIGLLFEWHFFDSLF